MTGLELRGARGRKNWTQEKLADRLQVTQAYLSMMESGRREVSYRLARKAAELLEAPATTLPLREYGRAENFAVQDFSSELAALGYPGFAHFRRAARRRNPAELLLAVLTKGDVATRVVEGLPWLALTYADLDWDWLVGRAKLADCQNRLGYVTGLAAECGDKRGEVPRARRLKEYVAVLERSRLAGEDTLCHDSLSRAEREWLREHRPAEARHWNLLTDLKVEDLAYAKR
ncbi:MAG TPA: helix-turn-helix transcriptional regulator [Candidatus Acidoferrum sp.]|jgi:transcriptional regulator with XRE-family HTH domain